jgi:hypothetical protein
MKPWQILVLLLALALVLPIGVRAFTGKWIAEFTFGEKKYGSTLTSFSCGGINTNYGWGTVNTNLGGSRAFASNTESYSSTDISEPTFHYLWDWKREYHRVVASVNLPQTGWTMYPAVPIPGDLTKPLTLPSLTDVQKWLALPRIYSWDDLITQVQNVFDKTLNTIMEEKNYTMTLVGTVVVPIKFEWRADDPVSLLNADDAIPFNGEHILSISGFVKLDPSVAQSILTTENSQVKILGILGDPNIFKVYSWGNILPSDFTNTINNSFQNVFQHTYLTDFYPSTPSLTVSNFFGIPTGASLAYAPANTDFLISGQARGSDPSVFDFRVITSVNKYGPEKTVSYTANIPLMYAIKVEQRIPGVNTVENRVDNLLATIENYIPNIEWNHLFENWHITENIAWQSYLENLSLNNILENAPSFNTFTISPIHLPEITLPQSNVSNDIVTYLAGSSIPFNQVGGINNPVMTTPASVVEPYLVDIAIILVIVFAVLGILVWRKV